MMRTLIDIVMIITTTVIMLRSFSLITKYESESIADYAILLIYIFQCLPVLFDIIIGVPKYPVYFSAFKEALENNIVAVIYNIYIVVILSALAWVSNIKKKKQKNDVYENRKTISNINNNFIINIPSIVLITLVFIPVFHIVFTGNLVSYVVYGSPTQRSLSSNFVEWNSILIVLSIIALTLWYYKKRPTLGRILIFIAMAFIDVWASGKRYIFVTILFSYVYMYSLKGLYEKKKNRRILFLIIFMIIVVLLFSVNYLTNIRGISMDNDLYINLRVDFGRDDVVKFSIMREYITSNPILEYPGETVISTFLMLVPRSILPYKAYPHYRYLSAAIYGVPLLQIPAGITPSILEMSISNFGLLGMPICVLFLCWYCNVVDNEESISKKYLYAILLVGMLTQSLDSMWPVFYISLYFIFTKNIYFIYNNKRISFKVSGKGDN